MKKLTGLVIVIALYVATSWYFGVKGEEAFRQQLAEAEAAYQLNGVAIKIREYDRGIFSSRINATLDYLYGGDDLAFHIESLSQVQHGPVLFRGGFGVGLFSSVSDLKVITADDEINQTLTRLFGESIGEVITRGYFGNRYRSTWKVDPVDHQDADSGVTIKLDGLSLSVQGAYNNRNLEGGIALGEFTLQGDGETLIQVSPLNGQFNMEYISDVVAISSGDTSLARIDLNISGVPLTLEGISVVQKQQLNNNKINTHVQFTMDKISGPVEISDFEYLIDLENLDPKAVESWMQISDSINRHGEEDPAAWVEDSIPALSAFLAQTHADNTRLDLVMRAHYGGHPVEASMQITPNELLESQLFTPAGAINWLPLINTDMRIVAAAPVVEQSILVLMASQYVGTYVQKEGDNYIVHARLEEGRVFIGSQEIPAELVAMALFPGEVDAPLDEEEEQPDYSY